MAGFEESMAVFRECMAKFSHNPQEKTRKELSETVEEHKAQLKQVKCAIAANQNLDPDPDAHGSGPTRAAAPTPAAARADQTMHLDAGGEQAHNPDVEEKANPDADILKAILKAMRTSSKHSPETQAEFLRLSSHIEQELSRLRQGSDNPGNKRRFEDVSGPQLDRRGHSQRGGRDDRARAVAPSRHQHRRGFPNPDGNNFARAARAQEVAQANPALDSLSLSDSDSESSHGLLARMEQEQLVRERKKTEERKKTKSRRKEKNKKGKCSWCCR